MSVRKQLVHPDVDGFATVSTGFGPVENPVGMKADLYELIDGNQHVGFEWHVVGAEVAE